MYGDPDDAGGDSWIIRRFCKEAFGEDFSQDGFSDLEQVNRILKYIPEKNDIHILDIGCGNGKMLGYLQKKIGAHIYGFDYSFYAVRTARKLFHDKADFVQGKIGAMDYPEEMFDLLMLQTDCVNEPYDSFSVKNARYVYVIRK